MHLAYGVTCQLWQFAARRGMSVYALLKPLVFKLDPERAHTLTVAALKTLPLPRAAAPAPQLRSCAFGLDFPSPVGLAAGFDKNAEVPDAVLKLGFGFAEVGTITPLPQAGNAKPRLFRLMEDRAVINRMGFNNDGLAAAVAKLKSRHGRPGIVGVNVGANKDSADRIADYVTCIKAVLPCADYVTINISSPNTPGLRALQSRDALMDLIGRCVAARGLATQGDAKTPMLVKIAPDLTDDDVADIAEIALATGIDGLIVSNTTLARTHLVSRHAAESGGLSGAPLFEPSTAMLRKLAQATAGKIPLVGVGGITTAAQAYAKIRNGASLVQIYSGLVYEGPGLAARLNAGLAELLVRDGFSTITQAVGRDV
jgi:dihydroorotate dehydrogenase